MDFWRALPLLYREKGEMKPEIVSISIPVSHLDELTSRTVPLSVLPAIACIPKLSQLPPFRRRGAGGFAGEMDLHRVKDV